MAIGTVAYACGGDGGRSGTPVTPAGQTSVVTTIPTPSRPAGIQISFLNEVGDIVLAAEDGTSPSIITAGGGFTSFDWSPDGTLIAATRVEGSESGVVVLQPDGVFVADVPDATAFKWSPDSQRLAVVTPGGVRVVGRDGLPVAEIERAVRPEWGPDSSAIAVVKLNEDGQGVPVIVVLDTGEELPVSENIEPGPPDYPLAWHPAGTVIAYKDRLYDLGNGNENPAPGVAVEWSPDGRLLLAATTFDASENATDGQLIDYTLPEPAPIIGFFIRQDPLGTPPWEFIKRWTSWSDDSRRMIYLDPKPLDVRARVYDTVEITQDRHEGIQGEYPDFSPDGTYVVYGYDGGVWLFSIDGTFQRRVATGSLPEYRPGT